MGWKIMHYFSYLGTFGNVMTPPPLFELFPTETWELFEFSMTPPVGNFSQVSALVNLSVFSNIRRGQKIL